jgi:hypothetical protein
LQTKKQQGNSYQAQKEDIWFLERVQRELLFYLGDILLFLGGVAGQRNYDRATLFNICKD